MKERLLGLVHPDVGITCNNLASLYNTRGQDAMSLLLYRRALVIFEKALGRGHPHSRVCRENLAQLPVLPK